MVDNCCSRDLVAFRQITVAKVRFVGSVEGKRFFLACRAPTMLALLYIEENFACAAFGEAWSDMKLSYTDKPLCIVTIKAL